MTDMKGKGGETMEKKGGEFGAKWIATVVLLAIALVACLAAYIQMNRRHVTADI